MDCSGDHKIPNLKDFFIYITSKKRKRKKIAALFCTDIEANILNRKKVFLKKVTKPMMCIKTILQSKIQL